MARRVHDFMAEPALGTSYVRTLPDLTVRKHILARYPMSLASGAAEVQRAPQHEKKTRDGDVAMSS